MLNWIVWNRTDYLYKNRFGVNKGWYAIKPKQPTRTKSKRWKKKKNKGEKKTKRRKITKQEL